MSDRCYPRREIQRGPGPRLRRRQVRVRHGEERIAYLERWNRALIEHAVKLDKYIRKQNVEVFTELYEPRLERIEESMEIVEDLLEVEL